MNHKTVLPKYRFPEFNDGWELVSLDSLAEKVTTKNRNNLINRTLTNSAAYGIIDQSDYFEREIVGKGNQENYFIVSKGDYVYNPRVSTLAPVGPISKNKLGEGIVSPLYLVFRFKNQNNDFYEHYFKSSFWHSYLNNISNTGARHDRISISSDGFMNIPVPCSSEMEQQKIADCFNSLDELIAAEDKKLTLLKAHKKGLMQKLFPAKGQNVPELRLSGFTDAWDTRNVDGYVKDYVEKTTKQNQHPILTSSQQQGIVFQEDYFANRQVTTANNIGYFVLPKGYFTYRSRSDNGSFRFNRNDMIDRGIISYFYPVFSIINGSSDFFLQLLNSQISKQTALAAEGTGQKVLSLKKFKNIEIIVPEIKEQNAIGSFLSNFDKKITVQIEKIEALKHHKKGLMQGLFPSAQEVFE